MVCPKLTAFLSNFFFFSDNMQPSAPEDKTIQLLLFQVQGKKTPSRHSPSYTTKIPNDACVPLFLEAFRRHILLFTPRRNFDKNATVWNYGEMEKSKAKCADSSPIQLSFHEATPAFPPSGHALRW